MARAGVARAVWNNPADLNGRAHVDARKLRYFVTVAQLGSFSEAARRLHIAQPALSRHVKDVEDSLGVALLVRDARGVKLTDAGEQLLAHALDVLHRLESLPRLVGSRSQTITGRVSIGLPTSTSAVLSAPLLRAAFERYPSVRIHLIESLSGYLQEWIEAGRIDLAILFDAQPTPGVRLDPILVEDMWLVGGPGALPGGEHEVPLAELGQYRFVLTSAAQTHRRLVEGMALSNGLRLQILAEVDSLAVQKVLVRDGSIFTILTHSAVHADLAEGRLSAARIVSPSISRRVAMASAAARIDSQACHAVAALTLQVARELVRDRVWIGRPEFEPRAAGETSGTRSGTRP
jgi:LysR family transcriptional regulator, nitrogen assimilation regulatory protein